MAENEPDERVLDAWGDVLGPPSTRRVGEMMHGHGRVWSVTTGRGHRFVLKQLTDTGAELDIDIDTDTDTDIGVESLRRRFTAATRIVTHLAGNGVPVAVPVPSDDGRVCVERDGVLWTLAPMLPEPTDQSLPTTDTLFQSAEYHTSVGRTIADLHVALADCPYAIDSWVTDAATFTTAWNRLSYSAPSAVVDELHPRIEPWRDRIVHALTPTRPQRIHGDIHGGNILMRDDRVVGIVDIDHLQIGPRTFDLGYNLVHIPYWAVKLRIPDGSAERGVAHAIEHTLDGYGSVLPLSAGDAMAILPTMLAAVVLLTEWRWQQHGSVDRDWIDTVRWLCDHESRLRYDPVPGSGDRRSSPRPAAPRYRPVT